MAVTHCLLQAGPASFWGALTLGTSQPCFQPTWLLAGPCQHDLIYLCEPGMTRMGIKGKLQSATGVCLARGTTVPQTC